ncbi:MAG: amidase family protein, partial [Acetobacteraceae bacterium]
MSAAPASAPASLSPAEMQMLTTRAGLVLNPGQVADLVLVWRQLSGLIALLPRERPMLDDQAFVFRLPAPAEAAPAPDQSKRIPGSSERVFDGSKRGGGRPCRAGLGRSRTQRAGARQGRHHPTRPGQVVPSQTIPGQTIPGQIVPGQIIPDQTTRGQAVASPARFRATCHGQTHTRQAPRIGTAGQIAPKTHPAEAMTETTPPFLTIAEAARLFAGRKLGPVELTRALLARIAAVDPALNAFITVTERPALAAARAAERALAAGQRHPLLGVPLAFKDIFETAGIRTTAHSKLLAENVPARDAETVHRLRTAGAVMLGKLATHEFAIGGPAFDLPWP